MGDDAESTSVFTKDYAASCELVPKVHRALANSHQAGAFARRGLADEPLVAGYVVAQRRHYDSWAITVDHAGKGRTKALASYAATLGAAGFSVKQQPWPHQTRPVLFVLMR